jgi:hypothetical protein
MIDVETRVRITTGKLAGLVGVLTAVTAEGLAMVAPDLVPGVRIVIGVQQLRVIEPAP